MIKPTSTLSICRITLAFIWFYQGLVPKWLGPHADELAMNAAAGFDAQQSVWIAFAGGAMEMALGVWLLICHSSRFPYVVSATVIAILYVFTVIYAPQFLTSAFNSITVNSAVLALSIIALVELKSERRNATNL